MNMKWDGPKSKYFPERVGEFDWSKKCYFQKEKTPSDYLYKDYSSMPREFQCQYIAQKVYKNVDENLNMKVDNNSSEMNRRDAIIRFAKGVMAVNILSWIK